MNYEQEINDIKKDVSALITDMAVIKDNVPRMEEALKDNTKAYTALNETLHNINTNMIAMNNKIDNQGKDIEEVKNNLEETRTHFNGKIQAIRTKIDSVDEEGKFNIRTFFRQYLPWIIVVLGLGIYIVSTAVKF